MNSLLLCLLMYKSMVAVEVALLAVPEDQLCTTVEDKVLQLECETLVANVTSKSMTLEARFMQCLNGEEL